jgi:hypothetical protein
MKENTNTGSIIDRETNKIKEWKKFRNRMSLLVLFLFS